MDTQSSVSSSVGGSLRGSLPGGRHIKQTQSRITLRVLKKMDEETQVALALTASMEPQKVGARTKQSSKPSRTKVKFAAPPPVLVERDPADSKRIVADRVAALVGRCRRKSSILFSLPESGVKQKFMANELLSDGTSLHCMWTLSERLMSLDLHAFYVADLVPPIVPRTPEDLSTPAWSLSQVPGFRLSLDVSQPRSISVKLQLESSEMETTPMTPVTVKMEPGSSSTAWPDAVKIEPKSPTFTVKQEPGLKMETDCSPSVNPTGVLNAVKSEDIADDPLSDEDDENDDARTLILFSSSEDEIDLDV